MTRLSERPQDSLDHLCPGRGKPFIADQAVSPSARPGCRFRELRSGHRGCDPSRIVFTISVRHGAAGIAPVGASIASIGSPAASTDVIQARGAESVAASRPTERTAVAAPQAGRSIDLTLGFSPQRSSRASPFASARRAG